MRVGWEEERLSIEGMGREGFDRGIIGGSENRVNHSRSTIEKT